MYPSYLHIVPYWILCMVNLPCKIWHGCARHFDVFTAKEEKHGVAGQTQNVEKDH